MNSLYENVENEIEGYKYVVEFSISVEDPLDTSNTDRLCICDTRDEACEEIRKHLEKHVKLNKEYNVTIAPYNITRLGTIVKWMQGEKSWWWNYGIFPVRYIKLRED